MATKETKLKKIIESVPTEKSVKALKPLTKEEKPAKAHGLVLPVHDLTGAVIGEETLNKEIFANPASPTLLAQALRVLSFNQRSGTAAVKDRSEVRGGGRKPWRQKGTGRARQGSIRSPQWRGGGVVQGPKPKDWGLDMSKRQKRSALLGALTLKAQGGEIVLLHDLQLKEAKTKTVFQIFGKLPLAGKRKTLRTLVILPEKDDTIYRATKNLPNTEVETVNNLNTLAVVTAHKLLLTKKTIEEMNNFFIHRKDQPIHSKALPILSKALATKKESN